MKKVETQKLLWKIMNIIFQKIADLIMFESEGIDTNKNSGSQGTYN